MTSPDVTPYVDLTLYDLTAQQVFEAGLALAQTRLPDWNPIESNIEVVLLEALAVEVSELVFAANRLPGAIIEILLRLYGINRDLGAPATATVTFALSDSLGHEIPEGTIVRVSLPLGGTVDMITDAGAVVPPGSNTAVGVPVVAEISTDDVNGIAVGTSLELLDALTFVDSVVLASEPTGGRTEETGEDMLARGQTLLQRLVNTLVTPAHFVAAAALEPDVVRAAAADLYNSDAGSGVPGDHPGHISVAVAGSNGSALSPTRKAEILALLDAQAIAMLAVHIADVTVTNVAVTCTVVRLDGYTDADVTASILATLTAYLNPDTWPFGRPVYRNELISVIDNVDGVDRVVSITAPAADVALTGVAGLARVGAVNVTVQAP